MCNKKGFMRHDKRQECRDAGKHHENHESRCGCKARIKVEVVINPSS